MALSLEEPKNICDQTFVAVLVSRLPGLLTDIQSAHQTLATKTTSLKLEIYLIFAPFKKKKSTLKTLLNRMSSSSSVKALDWQIRRDKKSSVDNIRSLNTALLCLSCQASKAVLILAEVHWKKEERRELMQKLERKREETDAGWQRESVRPRDGRELLSTSTRETKVPIVIQSPCSILFWCSAFWALCLCHMP